MYKAICIVNHFLNKYLLSYHTGDTAVNKTDKNLCPLGLHSSDNKQINR